MADEIVVLLSCLDLWCWLPEQAIVASTTTPQTVEACTTAQQTHELGQQRLTAWREEREWPVEREERKEEDCGLQREEIEKNKKGNIERIRKSKIR
ncbi:hypothetical protein L484_004114 [Morus notabilis]|uniref:Uncharacterized protein n=1 Tax=Morus notabilis TaxID=981085 RepID=W9R2X1_9ROSA|nr:hypothetical protein L484_004114 [Morus notabilis]